jgi:hypothetical protein
MGEQPPHGTEIILDITAHRPGPHDPSAAGPGYDEQQLLLEMLADPDIAAALDEDAP